ELVAHCVDGAYGGLDRGRWIVQRAKEVVEAVKQKAEKDYRESPVVGRGEVKIMHALTVVLVDSYGSFTRYDRSSFRDEKDKIIRPNLVRKYQYDTVFAKFDAAIRLVVSGRCDGVYYRDEYMGFCPRDNAVLIVHEKYAPRSFRKVYSIAI